MVTLYRKYRPQNFNEIVGQNHIKITLEHEISTGKIAHAYLFCGPRAVGKTTFARLFAKAVNCTGKKEKDAEPCNDCDVCSEITNGRSLDIIEIDAASQTGVDNVRENIIANSRVMPAKLKYKVFIIDEVHMLSIQAFNALLKIIEEPPKYVIFILCTTEVHKVPATIISRCQRFDFKRISVNDITKKLQYIVSKENIKVEKGILESIARQSEGHMRDAESILGQVVSIGGQEITKEEADLVVPRSDLNEAVKLIAFLNSKNASAAITLVDKLINEGISLKTFLSDLIELLRKIMLKKINPILSERLGIELGESLEIEINNVSSQMDLNQIIRYIDRFLVARSEIKNSFIIQLPLEIAIAELCASSNSQTQTIGKNIPPQNPPSQNNLRPQNFTRQIPSPQNNGNSNNNKPITSNVDLNIDFISSRWHEVLARVKKHNHSLSFILRVCQPKNIIDNQLCLAFKYKFHRDRMGDITIKTLVEKILQEVYEHPLVVEAIIDDSIEVNSNIDTNVTINNQTIIETKEEKRTEPENGNSTNMIENLLKTFGGKVVS